MEGGGGAPVRDRSSLRGLAPTERDAKGRVRHEALTDAVTQVPNRLHFDVVYRLLWEAGGRGIPVTLIVFELGGFASVAEGEQRRVGDLLNLITRQMDMIARLEEERFGVLLVDCNAFGGMVAAERFRAELMPLMAEIGFSFDAGIAAWKDWMVRPDDLLEAAAEAMRAAQAVGGGQIEMHRR